MNRKEFLTHFALAGTAAMMIPALAKANVFGFGLGKKVKIGIIGCGSVSGVYLKGAMHLIGYDWMPFAVEMATIDHEEPQRFATKTDEYVWQEGASEISQSLLEGYDPLINVEHSLHVLEIIEAARKSQKEGKRIKLESVFPYPVIKQ